MVGHKTGEAGVEIATSPLAWDYQIYSRATCFSSLIGGRASGKTMQKSTSHTTMTCADGIVKWNVECNTFGDQFVLWLKS